MIVRESVRSTALCVLGLGLLGSAHASSHREAPFITTMPKVDASDLYLFRSYEADREAYVTLIANYQPLQDAYGGPNYFAMDPDALYEIHIDNNGDAIEDLTFQFRFVNAYAGITVNGETSGSAEAVNNAIPLINLPPVGNQPSLNLDQTYTVELVSGPRRGGNTAAVTRVTDGSAVFTKPVDNIGSKSIPDYAAYAEQFIYTVNLPGCASSGRLFVGQRSEGFVVNLGQVFDLVNLNPLGPRDAVDNRIADANVTSLALELPIACVTSGSDPVIGAWTTASKRQARLLNPTPTGPTDGSAGRGPAKEGGAWTQVSRLGSPLVNEVVIGITDKDRFNASEPRNDVANFGRYVLYPTLPVLVNALFEVPPPATPRNDLLSVFVTGITANVNGGEVKFTAPENLRTPGEMLRINTAFPGTPTAPDAQRDLGFLDCDLSGFPNGRRPLDDVVDIALTVAEGALTGHNDLQTCDVSGPSPTVVNPGAVVNDGARPRAEDYLRRFPYLGTPRAGNL